VAWRPRPTRKEGSATQLHSRQGAGKDRESLTLDVGGRAVELHGMAQIQRAK
jgi:hypothetical protein